MTSIQQVAERLGARLKRISAVEYAGPCPKCCTGRDRFSVNVKLGVFNCRVCDVGGDSIALARHVLGIDFQEALEFVGDDRANEKSHGGGFGRGRQVSAQVGQKVLQADASTEGGLAHRAPKPEQPAPASDDAQRIAVALFRESVNPRGTVVERYFASRRLEIADLAGRVIRWNSRIGAAVALFRNISTGEPQAVSRTYLDANACKTERKFLGPVGGAAIMLDPFDCVTHGLHIAEGIETAQSARQLGLRPTWALGSAGSIASLPVLGGVECLTLLAENDPASERAVVTVGERWHAAGRFVLINRPLKGNDLNDAIRRAA